MSERNFPTKFGVKIHNMNAAIIDEYNRGIRPYLSYTKAVIPNSLLLDYLIDHGLKINGNSTKQLIGVSFEFGCGSFDHELKKLQKKLENAQDSEEVEFYRGLLEAVRDKSELYEEKTKARLREQFYTEGVTISYPNEEIHYLPLYRSSGRAKLGACTFIDERLYEDAIDFLRMGMKFEPEQELDIVSLQAYSALAASSIKDRIYIDPDEVLVIEDVDSIFHTKVISIETDENQQCFTREVEDYPLKNTLFDGQSLIDDSLWDDEHFDGYILLRNLFFKSAAFHCRIQDYFRDYFKEKYETATIRDIWGREVPARNIKLITTNNSIKWQKFPVDFDYWADQIREKTKGYWGIVKSAYVSKLGDVQRMSYQMVNALDLSSIDSVIKNTKQYVAQLKSDDEVFIDFLKRNQNYANDFEVLIELYKHNPLITQSSYFRRRRNDIIYQYSLDIKNGRLLQNADNLVIVGSPMAMLMAAVGEDPLQDPTFRAEEGCIQVSTKRFDDDTYLASFRSPFNSQNNLCCLHNVHNEYLDLYFPLGRQIIAVNLIGTDFQARNNGSDQDSDSIYVTDQEAVVAWARKCVDLYPTIDNNIPKDTNVYHNNPHDFAAVDTKIASANMAIGESSNLAQLCLTYGFNFPDQKYKDYACILAVLAQVAIDNAKRSFQLDLSSEIRRIKTDLDIKKNGLPLFWFYIKRKGKFGKQSKAKQQIMENFNPSLVCPMNYVCETQMARTRAGSTTIQMKDYFVTKKFDGDYRKSRKVEQFIQKYCTDIFDEIVDGNYDNDLFEIEFEEMIEDIKKLYISKDYQNLMLWLLKRAFQYHNSHNNGISKSLTSKNRPILLKTLYTINKDVFLSCFKTAEEMNEYNS